MEAMRQSWTDDRLDDLSHRMDERFDQVEGQIADTRMEMRSTAISLRFDRVHEDMRQLNATILGLHQTMTRIAWSAAIMVLAGVIGVLLTNL